MAGGSLVFVQVVEVEVEQLRGFVGILFVEWHEAIAEVDVSDCCCMSLLFEFFTTFQHT